MRQFLDILSLLLGALSQLLHLLALHEQLVLQSGVLGGVDAGLGLLVHEHVAQAQHLVGERLQLYFKLFQLCELQCPLQVLDLSLFDSHVALELFDALAEVGILLCKLGHFQLLLHLLLLARPSEGPHGHQLRRCLQERAMICDACIHAGLVEPHGLLVGANLDLIRQLRYQLVLLPQVSVSHLQVCLEDGDLLHSVVALLFEGDRFGVESLFLEVLDVHGYVLLARGVILGQAARQF